MFSLYIITYLLFKNRWNDLDKFTNKSQTFSLINNIELQIKSSEEGKNTLKDFHSVEELINNFWREDGILEFREEMGKDQIGAQIELFMSFLKATRVIVDLGFSTKEMNDNILYGVGHIFAPIMEEKLSEDTPISKENFFEKNGLNKKHWIMCFIKKLLDMKDEIHQEIEGLLHQTTKIFMIFAKIRINLQIIKFELYFFFFF